MVFGLFPSFFHSSRDGTRDKRSPSPTPYPRKPFVKPPPTTSLGFGSAIPSSPNAETSWSPLLGIKGIHNSAGFAYSEGAITPGSTDANSSQGETMSFSDVSLELPAWCLNSETPSLTDIVHEDAIAPPSMNTAAKPHRTLRRVGNLNGTNVATVPTPQNASPDLDGGADTTSFVLDPYLYPTPANRPLRQYVSAPTLGSADVEAAPQTGMVASSSMDDLLQWPSVSHTFSADATAAPPSDVVHGLGLAGEGGQPEIDGSLYLRRAQQHSQGQMPSPRPIHTAPQPTSLAASVGNQQHDAAQQQQPTPVSAPPTDDPAAAQRAYQERLRQQDEQAMHSAAIHRSNMYGFYDAMISPAQQHAGTASNEVTARNVQAALLFGHDSPERRNSLEGMDAFDSQGHPKGMTARMPASPYVAAPSSSDQHHHQGGRYFVYSSGGQMPPAPAVSSGMPSNAIYTSVQPPSHAPHQQPSYTHHASGSGSFDAGQQGRQRAVRKQSMPGVMLSHYDTPAGNVFEMEGLPDFNRGQPSISRQSAPSQGHFTHQQAVYHHHHQQQGYARPLSQAESVPLMPVALPHASPFGQVPTHPWSHPPPPPHSQQVPYHQSFSALGAPDSGNSMASGSHPMPMSAESFLSSSSAPLPATPPSAKRAAEEPQSATVAKKSRSSPNLRSPRAERAEAGEQSSTSVEVGAAGSRGSPSVSPTTSRKIASNRRVQSSKDLRGKTPSAAKPSPSSSASAANSPSRAAGGGGAGFAFVNYGIEDAKELCSAVAPSGSYKIPLKGYGDGSLPNTPAKKPSAAGAAAIAAHKKTTPRVPVDTSRWIFETGEESGDEDDDEEGDEEGGSQAKRKRSKSGASASASASASKGKGSSGSKKVNPAALGEAIVLTSEK